MACSPMRKLFCAQHSLISTFGDMAPMRDRWPQDLNSRPNDVAITVICPDGREIQWRHASPNYSHIAKAAAPSGQERRGRDRLAVQTPRGQLIDLQS